MFSKALITKMICIQILTVLLWSSCFVDQYSFTRASQNNNRHARWRLEAHSQDKFLEGCEDSRARKKNWYEDTQCENHLNKTLKPALKDFLELNSSGSVGILELIPNEGARELMGLMYDYMGHCQSVQPKKTFAAGLMVQEKRAPNVGLRLIFLLLSP